MQIPFSTAELIRILDGRLHSPIHDCVGDNYTEGSPLAMTADTDYVFECNCNLRNYQVLPTHITHIWNGITNVATFEEFDNTPELVANIGFVFNPSISAEGIFTVTAWVNETVPLLIKSTRIHFKSTPERNNALITFYAGSETGFDVKNKGVFFKISSSANGNFYDPSIEIYRT